MKEDWDIRNLIIIILLLENTILLALFMWVCITFSGGYFQGRNQVYEDLIGTNKQVTSNLKAKEYK